MRSDVIVLGGGITGLALADALSARGRSVCVLEGQETFGGLLRTISLGGHLFDTGPHGIYAPDDAIAAWFRDLLGDALVPVERRSFTLFRGQRVPYPLTLGGALRAVSPLEAARVAFEAGVLRGLRGAPPHGASFEQWAVRSFGSTLYRLFFKDYTEKVWGIPCDEMAAGWITAHLPANSLLRVLYDRLRQSNLPIGFVNRFHYSAHGSGYLVERIVERLTARPLVCLRPGHRIARLEHDGNVWAVAALGQRGLETWEAPEVVSTIPIGTAVGLLAPPPAEEVLSLARGLRFRNLVLVLLVVDVPQVSEANWLYVPDRSLGVARISEFKNMIASMRKRPDTSLELELYCWPTDPLWRAPEEEIVGKAVADAEALGLLRASQVTASKVVRVPNAYPVFDLGFEDTLERIHTALERWRGLHLMGRTGAFLYLDQAGCVKRAFAWAADHAVASPS